MQIKDHLKGIILSTVLASLALFLSSIFKSINPMLFGLLIGIILGNFVKIPNEYNTGIQYTSGKMLEMSLLFLAIGINFTHINKIGASSFIFLSLAVLMILVISLVFTKKFNHGNYDGYLVGFGSAICGSSAIAAVAPTIKAEKSDVAISLAVVNLLGTVGMIVLPEILHYLNVSELRSGFILGGGLHSVANVSGAGFAMGEETARYAITIKLARVALLSPALILYSYFIKKDSVKNWKEHFKLPWYVWSFIIISTFASFVAIDPNIIKQSENIGKIILTIAMVAIGLKISIKTLFNTGKKSILFGTGLFILFVLILSVFSMYI